MARAGILTRASGWMGDFFNRLEKTLRKECGWTDEQVHALVTEEDDEKRIKILAAIIDEVVKRFGAFKRDMTKDGWTLLERGPAQTLTAAGFDLVPFLKDRESYVKGDIMSARAVELRASLGQHDAEYLLENQHLIPTEYRGKYYLVFPGTKWRRAVGGVGVPVLVWRGDRWGLRLRRSARAPAQVAPGVWKS